MEPEVIREPGAFASQLLHRDTDPLAASETRSATIDIRNLGSIGGDIFADQACSMKFHTSPDGDNYGTPTELAVAAGEGIRFEYVRIAARAIKVEVVNGATPMTAFRLYIRGGA